MTPGRIALLYGVVGATWILVSDLFAFRSGYVPGAVKGVAFVVTTGLLLFLLLRRFERELTRERLAALASAERYQTLIEHAPVGLFVSKDGLFQYANPKAARLLGVAATSALAGTNVLDRFDPAHHEQIRDRIENPATGGPEPFRVVCRTTDEHTFDAELTAVPFDRDGQGAALVYLADVAERAGRERLFRELAESIPANVWIADEDGLVSYLNDRWYSYTGQTRMDATLQLWTDVLHPEDAARVVDAWRRALETKTPYEVRCRYRRHDGVYRWYLGRALPIVASEGRVVNWFGISTDVDEPVRLLAAREAAAEAERESLARELHDDLGQLLAAVKLNVELALLTGKELPDRLTKAREGLQHCMQRTRNMAIMMRPAVLDHGGLVAALRAQARDFEATSRIACSFQSNAETVPLSYPSALAVYRIVQEALTNISKHAGASHVTIEVSVLPDSVRTVVSDDGHGFDLHNVERAGGLGLVGMRERALAAASQLSVQSSAVGTQIQLDSPLPARPGTAVSS